MLSNSSDVWITVAIGIQPLNICFVFFILQLDKLSGEAALLKEIQELELGSWHFLTIISKQHCNATGWLEKVTLYDMNLLKDELGHLNCISSLYTYKFLHRFKKCHCLVFLWNVLVGSPNIPAVRVNCNLCLPDKANKLSLNPRELKIC